MSKTEEKTESALIKPGASVVEFMPFGTKDKIQLTVEVIKRLIAVKTRSGKNCSDEEAFKFMLMCQARKLNPFEGDAFLIGYDNRDQPDKPNFSLITAHQAFLKRAEVHPEFDGMESGTIVMRNNEVIDLVGDWHMPNDTILGGWAKVYFKSRSKPMEKRLRLARFKKNYGIWNDDPAGMIVKCAEADALRSSFPTMLGGLYISEESEQRAAEIARPVFDVETTTEDGTQTETVKENGDRMRAAIDKRGQSAPAQREPEPKPERRQQAKKKEAPAAFQRKSAPAEKKEPTIHEQFAAKLAVGNVTPQQFVAIALAEGWIDTEQGSWDQIPEDRMIEFMKPGNWTYLVGVLEDKATAAAAPSDKLL